MFHQLALLFLPRTPKPSTPQQQQQQQQQQQSGTVLSYAIDD